VRGNLDGDFVVARRQHLGMSSLKVLGDVGGSCAVGVVIDIRFFMSAYSSPSSSNSDARGAAASKPFTHFKTPAQNRYHRQRRPARTAPGPMMPGVRIGNGHVHVTQNNSGSRSITARPRLVGSSSVIGCKRVHWRAYRALSTSGSCHQVAFDVADDVR
jgi:hypothetical protein